MTSSRWLGCLVLVLLTACRSGSGGYVEPSDGPPLHTPPDIANLPNPIPTDEPKSKRGNPPSYTVRGKTYHVLDTAVGYKATGNASWYGRKFHGRLTSSGEPFDMFKLTAAHTTLPIPTYLRVTNLANGRSTIVRVNDRGPFHSERIIDLSYAAAVKLDFAASGTARVQVETLAKQPDFFLQAGAFRELAAADALSDNLRKLTGTSVYVVRVSDDRLFRVRVGPVRGHPEALRLQALIMAADYGQPLILRQ
ncbi:MAG: septal ring lytic transglycosylase RlpA family protein [Gammaproteobacteria bacterium]|nr:septal ring lytic transglycosylase RlpA family protein [Gammaproteobacteria bacterium]